MKWLLAVLALATWTVAPTLRAQPAASFGVPSLCLLEGVTAEQRALAGPAALQRLTDVPADGEPRGGSALAAILTALPRCARAGRWTEAQRDMAQEYVLIVLALEDMRRRYAAQNVDLSVLDNALPFEEQVARVRGQGVTGDRPDSAEDIVFIYRSLEVRRTMLVVLFEGSGRDPQ